MANGSPDTSGDRRGRRRWRVWVLLGLAAACGGLELVSFRPGPVRPYDLSWRSGRCTVDLHEGLLVACWRTLARANVRVVGEMATITNEEAVYLIRCLREDWSGWRPELEVHKGYGAVSLPLWIPATLFLAGAAWSWRRDRGFPPGHCARCGYDLTGNVSGRCPECGNACENRQIS